MKNRMIILAALTVMAAPAFSQWRPGQDDVDAQTILQGATAQALNDALSVTANLVDLPGPGQGKVYQKVLSAVGPGGGNPFVTCNIPYNQGGGNGWGNHWGGNGWSRRTATCTIDGDMNDRNIKAVYDALTGITPVAPRPQSPSLCKSIDGEEVLIQVCFRRGGGGPIPPPMAMPWPPNPPGPVPPSPGGRDYLFKLTVKEGLPETFIFGREAQEIFRNLTGDQVVTQGRGWHQQKWYLTKTVGPLVCRQELSFGASNWNDGLPFNKDADTKCSLTGQRNFWWNWK